MISACITDPFAGWLRIKDSLIGAFTSPRNGAQAAGCTEPDFKLLPTDDVCQLEDASPSSCAFDQQLSRESGSDPKPPAVTVRFAEV